MRYLRKIRAPWSLQPGRTNADSVAELRETNRRAKLFLGLEELEAIALADSLGQRLRILRSKKEVDQDDGFQPGRVTVVLRDGEVTKAYPG